MKVSSGTTTGARIVFWPESLIDVTLQEAAVIEREAGRTARELGIYLMPSFHRKREAGEAGSQRDDSRAGCAAAVQR